MQSLTLQYFGYPCMGIPVFWLSPTQIIIVSPTLVICFYLVLWVPQSIPRSLAIWVSFVTLQNFSTMCAEKLSPPYACI